MSKIFISYKRVDKDRVFAIKDEIENALNVPCWIDLDGIESDSQFINVIIKAINECEIFLFMYSKAHGEIVNFEKDWTMRELNFAMSKGKRIIFVNIDGAPLTDQFTFMFGTQQQVDATSTYARIKLIKDLRKLLGRKYAPEPFNKRTSNVKDKVAKFIFMGFAILFTQFTGAYIINLFISDYIKTYFSLIILSLAIFGALLWILFAIFSRKYQRTINDGLPKIKFKALKFVCMGFAIFFSILTELCVLLTGFKVYLFLIPSIFMTVCWVLFDVFSRKCIITPNVTPTKTKEHLQTNIDVQVQSDPTPIKSKKWLWLWLATAVSVIAIGVATLLILKPWKDTNIPDTHFETITGKENGHEWLDMGTSVKWATNNVGASLPMDPGLYYAWGELFPADSNNYVDSVCILNNQIISNIGGYNIYDVASNSWGGNWRMPTKEDFQELIDSCEFEWHSNGMIVRAKNGNGLFLPAAGRYRSTILYSEGDFGGYWTDTPNDSVHAWYLHIHQQGQKLEYGRRYDGRSIRPVMD